MSPITINAQRLWDDLMTLARFTEPNTPGWTRRFPSTAYQQGRQWLQAQMEAEGLTTHIDAAGNLFGRREGRENLPPIHVGSHTDTVMGGGRFDGALGVLGAFEAVRTLREDNLSLRHPLVVADYISEEATDYAVACMGSLAMCTDHFRAEWLERTVGGVTLRQAIIDMGGQPDKLGQPLVRPGEIAASLELHIEQGPVLEARGVKLAAVSGIVGIHRALLELQGKANHAGATPMDLRHDALAAAARMISAIEEIARAHPGTVGTVGKLEVQPNQGNVIAGAVTMMAEMRSLNMQEVDGMWAEFMTIAQKVCAERGITVQIFNETRMDSVIPPQWLHELVGHVCQRLDPHAIITPSGAGHDTSYVGLIAPAAMIFVPSLDGRSHAPEEYTAPEDLARGVQALAETIVEVDKSS
ncbi:MAG: Zn-dependent hydrolase [Chloroflexi bacterium]|nr:Zn-dependent hydrolase [Chloroflexota bacterium]